MTLQQLKEEARREFEKKFKLKPSEELRELFDSLITKAYEEGKRERDPLC